MQQNSFLIRFFFLWLSFIPLLSLSQSQPLVFTGATVIDMTGAKPKPDMTVIVTGNRISAIGKTGKIHVPKNAREIDAKGKFLIPGLWDMHAHPFLTKQEFFPQFVFNLYIANGVTGLRDMFGPLEEEKQWVKAIEAGTIPGPRMVMAGPLLDGPTSIVPGATVVTNEAEARQAVRDLKQRGAEFVKVYERLSLESYYAISDEAKRQGLTFVGHVPAVLTAVKTSDAGQKTIEHFSHVAIACSSDEEELQKQWTSALLAPDGAITSRDLTRVETRALETLDEGKCRELAARFVKNGTWQDPTLVVLRIVAFANDTGLTNDPRLRYIPRAVKKSWSPANHELWKAFTGNDFATAQKAFPNFLKITRIMHHAGVKFLAGTDPPIPYCLPGFSIHDELALFVKAGLTPMEVLQTATCNPAEFLGRLNDLGTIEQGKIADLVLLESNPLQDIRNTQKIHAVVLNGRLVTKKLLQKMLVEVEVAADKK